jgi:hypothetical protein
VSTQTYHIDQGAFPVRSARWFLAPVTNTLEDAFAYLLDTDGSPDELIRKVEQAINDCASARLIASELNDIGKVK